MLNLLLSLLLWVEPAFADHLGLTVSSAILSGAVPRVVNEGWRSLAETEFDLLQSDWETKVAKFEKEMGGDRTLFEDARDRLTRMASNRNSAMVFHFSCIEYRHSKPKEWRAFRGDLFYSVNQMGEASLRFAAEGSDAKFERFNGRPGLAQPMVSDNLGLVLGGGKEGGGVTFRPAGKGGDLFMYANIIHQKSVVHLYCR